MNPIRPQLPQPAPATQARSASDARAAFFQAVKGAAATTPTGGVQSTLARPTPPPARPTAPAASPAAPQRYLRPGSIVDIKV